MSDILLTGTVGADGRAVITLRADAKQKWQVQQVSPEMASAPASAVGNVRRNGALVAPFSPSGDAVGGEPYPTLGLGDTLTVEWANCVPGASCSANFFYEVLP
jgi:hypothetical protein